mmetsp:Transcript_2961/g.8340  ORF Transcript_2961/g.8340 Transcript_2961/m.8340 type:complete len:134 (-) Transcript_2961:810-1211(-)
MFAAFSARALDPPFSTVSMDSDDSVSTSPELPGEHLKALLAKQGVNAKKGLSFPHGGFATAGAAVFLEQEGLAILSTGSVTNIQEVCDLYEISPLPESVAELVNALYEKEFTDSYGDCSDQPATAVSSIEVSV